MSKSKKEFKLFPIGHVRRKGEETFIEILEPYRPALKELDKFSHVIIFWWAHENDIDEIRNSTEWQITPPYGEDAPVTGIFATRAEYRPNPIAITTTNILELNERKGILKVGGLDAFDDTPVVDIKAYFSICDRVRDCHIAPWLKDWPEWLEDGIVWWQEQGYFEEE